MLFLHNANHTMLRRLKTYDLEGLDTAVWIRIHAYTYVRIINLDALAHLLYCDTPVPPALALLPPIHPIHTLAKIPTWPLGMGGEEPSKLKKNENEEIFSGPRTLFTLKWEPQVTFCRDAEFIWFPPQSLSSVWLLPHPHTYIPLRSVLLDFFSTWHGTYQVCQVHGLLKGFVLLLTNHFTSHMCLLAKEES